MENPNLIVEKEGMEVLRHFTEEGVNPFGMFTYETL